MKTIKSDCNNCLQNTNHFVIADKTHEEYQDINDNPHCYDQIYTKITHEMLECCGCETISLKRFFYCDVSDKPEETYYTPKISRQTPVWINLLPKQWVDLLKETYTALHADSRCLVLMGTRALIDLYLADQVGDIGSFDKKIKKLQNDGLISEPNKKILNAALDAGNASSHRGYKAEINEVNQVIDIVENLLKSYVLEKNINDLLSKTPKRYSNQLEISTNEFD